MNTIHELKACLEQVDALSASLSRVIRKIEGEINTTEVSSSLLYQHMEELRSASQKFQKVDGFHKPECVDLADKATALYVLIRNGLRNGSIWEEVE